MGPGFHIHPSLLVLHCELQHTTAERRNLMQLSGSTTQRLGFQANNIITCNAFPLARLERADKPPVPCVLSRLNINWTQLSQN